MQTLDISRYATVLDVLATSCAKHAALPSFSCQGQTLSFAQLATYSDKFAAYLQNHTQLQPGDRIAIQLPNTLMFPIAVFGALKAGLVVVNTNPLYTVREMAHQFNDSGAKGLVVLANMARKVQKILPLTCLEQVIIAELGDQHSFFKRHLINWVVKKVKKLVPHYNLPKAVSWRKALSLGGSGKFSMPVMQPNDLAILQYTGGTTGIAKGAMLSHKNLIANMLQAKEFIATTLNEGEETLIAPLPLYHIYSFTINCMLLMEMGNHSVLITDPRNLTSFIKEISKYKFSGFIGLNTLFIGLSTQPEFKRLDFSKLKLTVSGGMALTQAAAQTWESITGCPVAEGYGLTETAPIVSLNPPHAIQVGTIGLPMPATEIKVISLDGVTLPQGEIGELCVRGPQVMLGYWQQPEETALVLDADGWFKTGDLALVQADGYIRLVDRKKDMIIVSGFNVYPNEVEDVITMHPEVLEAAVLGVHDALTGEAVKVFIVAKSPDLTAQAIRDWCEPRLTPYKIPRFIEFRSDLPKTNVGKVLRRQLRDESAT